MLPFLSSRCLSFQCHYRHPLVATHQMKRQRHKLLRMLTLLQLNIQANLPRRSQRDLPPREYNETATSRLPERSFDESVWNSGEMRVKKHLISMMSISQLWKKLLVCLVMHANIIIFVLSATLWINTTSSIHTTMSPQ